MQRNKGKQHNGKDKHFFKKTRDIKGTFHASTGTIKDRNSKDLTEERVICQELSRIHRTIQKNRS